MLEAMPVLVGVDGSAGGWRAADLGAAEACGLGAPVTVCFVVAPPALDTPVRASESARRHGEEVLRHCTRRLVAGWPTLRVRTELVEGSPSAELIRLAAAHQLVVVGSHGTSGIAALVLGSVADDLVAHCPRPVLVVPERDGEPGGPVLLGVDGSDANQPAVEYAFAAADRHGRGVVALSAADGHSTASADWALAPAETDMFRDAIRPWAEKYPGVPVEHRIVGGSPGAELVQASDTASLTVVGSRGHGDIARLLLGSVSRHVSRCARSPVAVVRS